MTEEQKRLVEDNMNLAYKLAHQYKNTNIELEDLIQYATIGLIKAAKSFDSNKNVRFSTYANKCIINELNSASHRAKKHYNRTISLEAPASTVGLGDSYHTIGDMLISDFDLEYEYERKTDREFKKFIIGLFMSSKSELDKQIVKLRIHEMEFPIIARRLNCTLKSVSLRFYRMRDRIIQLADSIDRNGYVVLKKYSSQQLLDAIPTFNYLASNDCNLIEKTTEEDDPNVSIRSKAIRGVS
jgi:RNA polymerase sigma factor (sigma-70 family)